MTKITNPDLSKNEGHRKSLKAGAFLMGSAVENKRGWQRAKERAALKDQVRSAKAIQIKSTRGFA